MFIKTEDNFIVGVNTNSQIFWKEYNFKSNYYTRDGVQIICDNVVLKRYKDIKSQRNNIENAKSEISKIFEALKNGDKTYIIE